MTKTEAKDFGAKHGKMRAERICLEPPFHHLPEILTKWKSEKQWSMAADDDERWLRGKTPQMTNDQWRSAKAAYVSAGLWFVKSYIKELKDDGLLQEMR